MTKTLENEYRCPNDGKLLFKGLIIHGEVEIKCKACKQLVSVAPTPLDEIICLKQDCANRVSAV